MSHRRRCRLPSLPFNSASRRFIESRREGGRRGGAIEFKTPSLREIVTRWVDGRSLLREWSSRGMDNGCPPMPVAAGDTLRDWRADTVHASMSIVPEAE